MKSSNGDNSTAQKEKTAAGISRSQTKGNCGVKGEVRGKVISPFFCFSNSGSRRVLGRARHAATITCGETANWLRLGVNGGVGKTAAADPAQGGVGKPLEARNRREAHRDGEVRRQSPHTRWPDLHSVGPRMGRGEIDHLGHAGMERE